MPPAAWVGEFFQTIARARLTGSDTVVDVQRTIAQRLDALGYSVEQHPFRTNQRQLAAVTIGAAALGWIALLSAPLLVLPVKGWTVTVAGVAALAFAGLLAVGVANGQLPFDSTSVPASNVVGRRGTVRLWLVAHSDSKSQAVSLRGRVVGALCATVGTGLLVIALGLRLFGPLPLWLAISACVPALVGGAVLSFSRAADRSPGAVDNATGVVAALVAAEGLRDREDVGVLITDAEEFGLEGARAWSRVRPEGEYFVNFDGLDDRGSFRVMRHTARSQAGTQRTNRLAQALASTLSDVGRTVAGRLPPGVLVDGLVLAAAGLSGVTVSRGDWGTLGVVHTPHDSPERVTVSSAVAAGEAAARAIAILMMPSHDESGIG